MNVGKTQKRRFLAVIPSQLQSPLSAIAQKLGQQLHHHGDGVASAGLHPQCCSRRCTNTSCPAGCNLLYDVGHAYEQSSPVNLTHAAVLAAAADVVVVFTGCFSGEGDDRLTLFLNATVPQQDELVEVRN
jgi:hypothetical protein